MKVAVLYVGSSLLGPLKNAEQEINRDYKLDLRITAYNFGSPLNDHEWEKVQHNLSTADIVFIIHVMDGENAARLIPALQKYAERHKAVIVINCMPELMRQTRMGRLNPSRLLKATTAEKDSGESLQFLSRIGSWIGRQAARGSRRKNRTHKNDQYLRFIDKLPFLLKFVPNAGALRDIKHYLYLFCYFLQPTPANIRTMVLYAVKHYVTSAKIQRVKLELPEPETIPAIAIYHPDAPQLFITFEDYERWHQNGSQRRDLVPENTIGLLLMRPQVVSNTTKHYDALIKAIEAEGLNVIPALATLMDNRKACETFFYESGKQTSRVSQILSLTGFSFVGGPAMNDSDAASEFLQKLNRPYRSAVSLDTQSIEAWQESLTGLNPVQAGMQIAIPEIDGATEPFIYGGISTRGVEPVPLNERCQRFARRLRRWNRLRTADRSALKLAFVIFCFPPNKGNIGTAADLDVFPSIWDSLVKLKEDGYSVGLPESCADLRELLLNGNSEKYAATANVAYSMGVDEYRTLCPYVEEIEAEWGRAPGQVNVFGGKLLIQGISLGNVFIGIQPTFGYEGDPMRLMMARGGAPHHGFVAFYSYLKDVLNVDCVVHVGTHGSLEFMPGKQIGLSGECWPDRLIGELPNIYLYSVNNPSEGAIAKRRSYAELISYLTPPIENASLYKEFASLKEMVTAYRQTADEAEREKLFRSIEETSQRLNMATLEDQRRIQVL